MPSKPVFYLAAILSFLFCLPALAPADVGETLTITTYYPSPYGVYRELRSQRMAIGNNYIQSGTYDWETTDGDGGEIDYQADLVVQGNVGIGTANPASRLQIGTDTVLQQWSGSTPYVLIQGVDNEVATPALNIKDENQTEMFSVNTTGDSGVTARIYMQGNVGIGTTSPGAKLEVNGKVKIDDLTQAGGGAAVLTASGVLTTIASSIRYKENIRDYEGVLGRLRQLRPVHFTWKSNTATPGMGDFGFIAEDVNKIFPELITYEKDGKTIRGLKYEKLPILLIKALQEQQKEIEELKSQVKALKGVK